MTAPTATGPNQSGTPGEVFFYHLTRAPLEATLPMLLERSLAQGWRICLRGRDARQLEWLDEQLWLRPEDGFLPHGQAGGDHDARQPVLLTTGAEMPNDAHALIAIGGAEVTPEEMRQLTRVSVVFDGNDPDAVAAARVQWKAVVAAGVTAKYWSQENGPWEMKASAEASVKEE